MHLGRFAASSNLLSVLIAFQVLLLWVNKVQYFSRCPPPPPPPQKPTHTHTHTPSPSPSPWSLRQVGHFEKCEACHSQLHEGTCFGSTEGTSRMLWASGDKAQSISQPLSNGIVGCSTIAKWTGLRI